MTDKLFLTYFYRLPPKYSEQLTLLSIETMIFAPLASLMVSYWAFGNRQMFDNKIDPISTFNEITMSHHTLKTWDKTDSDFPHLFQIELMIYFVIAAIIFYFAYDFIKSAIWKVQVRKILPNYFDALKIQDCEDIVEDEEFFRLHGGFRIISDGSLAQLRCRIEEYYRNKELKKNSQLKRDLGMSGKKGLGGAPLNRDSPQINLNNDLEMRSQAGSDDSNFIGDKY